MIETLKQTQDAIAEIEKLTGWTLTNVARKVGLNRMTIVNIAKKDGTRTPTEDVMKKIETELQRVRELHGEK